MKGKFRKKEKVILVFDENDRRDFLTGFRKRKNVRRKVAQEENKKKEDDKRKHLRQEKREALRHHIQEYENQIENKEEVDEELLKQPERITHDFGQHTVTVSTITDEDMGKDFLSCAYPIQNQSRATDNKITTDTPKQTARGKSLRRRQFHKKAQKRKIQAASDKKSVKQKLKHKGGKRKIN